MNIFKWFNKTSEDEKIIPEVEKEEFIKKDKLSDMPSFEFLTHNPHEILNAFKNYYDYYTSDEIKKLIEISYDARLGYGFKLTRWYQQNRKKDTCLRNILLDIMKTHPERFYEFVEDCDPTYKEFEDMLKNYIIDTENIMSCLVRGKSKSMIYCDELQTLILDKIEEDYKRKVIHGKSISFQVYLLMGYIQSTSKINEQVKDRIIDIIISDKGYTMNYGMDHGADCAYNIIKEDYIGLTEEQRHKLIKCISKSIKYSYELFTNSKVISKDERMIFLERIMTEDLKIYNLLNYGNLYFKEFKMIIDHIANNNKLSEELQNSINTIFKNYRETLAKYPEGKEKLESLIVLNKLSNSQ